MKVKLKDYKHDSFIKIIREWSGLTQEEFGKAIGKSARQIQNYESGARNYDIRVLEKISEEFDIDIYAEKKE